MSMELLYVMLITVVPFLELRASIPYGIVMGLPWWQVFIAATLANILIAPIIFFIYSRFFNLFAEFKPTKKIFNKIVTRTQKKVQKYVDKYGVLGLAIFIGIPLPGSGVYSGALGAYLLGFNVRQYMIGAIIGVLIAGIAVTLLTLTGVMVV